MLYQVFCLVVTNENGTIVMNLLGGYFSTNNSNLSKKIELTFYWLDIGFLVLLNTLTVIVVIELQTQNCLLCHFIHRVKQ